MNEDHIKVPPSSKKSSSSTTAVSTRKFPLFHIHLKFIHLKFIHLKFHSLEIHSLEIHSLEIRSLTCSLQAQRSGECGDSRRHDREALSRWIDRRSLVEGQSFCPCEQPRGCLLPCLLGPIQRQAIPNPASSHNGSFFLRRLCGDDEGYKERFPCGLLHVLGPMENGKWWRRLSSIECDLLA